MLPACRTGRQGSLCQKSQQNTCTTLCTVAAAAFDAPHTHQPSPASHFVLLTTPPQHPLRSPYSTTPLLCFLLLPANCCNRKIVIDNPSIRQRVYIYLLRRALPRDLRVTTSTTPPTSGRKACHPPPPRIFAPDSASLGSPLLAAAQSPTCFIQSRYWPRPAHWRVFGWLPTWSANSQSRMFCSRISRIM